jgi:hypothetical protein
MLLEDARLSCPKPIEGLALGGARVSSKHCRHAHFLVEQRMRVNAELNHFEASSWTTRSHSNPPISVTSVLLPSGISVRCM